MNVQPRRPAGSSEGGRFAGVEKPAVNSRGLSLNACAGWENCEVDVNGTATVFVRTVNADGTVEVSTDTDDPSVWMLAHKGDETYWNDDHWTKQHQDRRLWSAPIVAAMTEQNLVAVDDTGHGSGVNAAMTAVSSPDRYDWKRSPHALTIHIARTRGLRLILSLLPNNRPGRVWFGDLSSVPDLGSDVLRAAAVTKFTSECLDRSPRTAIADHGYAEPYYGKKIFVGQNAEALWRALTEKDTTGWSALKQRSVPERLVAAAALYDSEAQRQLTTGLFEGIDRSERAAVRDWTTQVFSEALNPPKALNPIHGSAHRLTPEQQDRIRGFVETIEALNP